MKIVMCEESRVEFSMYSQAKNQEVPREFLKSSFAKWKEAFLQKVKVNFST